MTMMVRRSPSPGGHSHRPRLRASGRWTQCPALPGARVRRLVVRQTSRATYMRAWSRLWRRPWPQACGLVTSGAALRCCVPRRPVARRWSVCSSVMATATPRGWMPWFPRRTSRGCLPRRGRAAWGSCRGCRRCCLQTLRWSPGWCRRHHRRLRRRWARPPAALRMKTRARARSRSGPRRGRPRQRRSRPRQRRRALPPRRASPARAGVRWGGRAAMPAPARFRSRARGAVLRC
jgi:hypothetical protein